MTRTRMDAWGLTRTEGDWPAVLDAYERAVGLMRALDPAQGRPTNPLSWQFQAAIHGRDLTPATPDNGSTLWNGCQHQSWFFFPWHRMYLLAFEAIVQHFLSDDQWSLPYWYSIDPDDPKTAVLPPAFRDTTRPTNNLFTELRSMSANGGDPLTNSALGQIDLATPLLDALRADVFSTPDGIATFGGGERSTPITQGDEMGLLEGAPHGGVHVLVGNDFNPNTGDPISFGWMGDPATAGLDPIFWLHHANIDRIWQMWLDLDTSHTNPPDGDLAWFDTTFTFPKVGGGTIAWKVGEVMDTIKLGYQYESVASPSALAAPVFAGGPGIEIGEAEMPQQLPPQVIGATVDVAVSSDEPVTVALSEPADVGLAAEGAVIGSRAYLRIEGITGTAAAPLYQVYLDVPEGESPEEHPELRVGAISTFGIQAASRTDEIHSGTGLTTVFEITRVRDALADAGRWDPARVSVAFRPVIPVPSDPAAAQELAQQAQAREVDVRAARIAVVVT
ncbi:tyrosinase family protein [Rhodococcus wratislaviensis]|uniref:Tyrosinase copper-binding domain-containing protein n=1 Tax=Rhodococcus wratislaviensis NBRC 100605 TaxID=1219028 RepID=X0Q963_RHOWR|nr:tyrosinase family protein [Rhodococcus wratislaviensis]GAF48102.1 hypothetical protein RW1_049_00080 [Rhodococcus wratislaviensis NBRC 100605]